MEYKIECYSKTGVTIVNNLIRANGGKSVVEGFAIVTDYSFNKEQASVIIWCEYLVSRTSSRLSSRKSETH